MADRDGERTGSRRSVFDLIRSIPDLVGRLIRDEIQSARDEVLSRTKSLGVGVGILIGGLVVTLFALGFLLQGAAHALSLILPAWAASLVVGGGLVIVAGVLALAGSKLLKRGAPPVPTDTIDSVRKDVDAVKGR